MPGGDLIIDAVLPIASVTRNASKNSFSLKDLLGTGFIVGHPQRLITAKHVVNRIDNVVGIRVEAGAWMTVGLTNHHDHPLEDIRVYDLEQQIPCVDWFTLSAEEQFSSGAYSAWGYPEDVFYDRPAELFTGQRGPIPEIIYSAGHIRRRVSHSIPALKGAAFYELSSVIGTGASGGPVLTQRRGRLEVIGVYIGERTTQMGDRPPREIGYALRLAAVADWLRTLGVQVAP